MRVRRLLPLIGAVCSALLAVTAPPAAIDAKRPPRAKGIWTSPAELRKLPTKGAAWNALKAVADADLGVPSLGNQNSGHDVRTYAAALAYARTGNGAYRAKAAQAVLSAIGTENNNVLALARGLVAYVIAADLIDLATYDPAGDRRFRDWLRELRNRKLNDSPLTQSLVLTHERRANNFGTHAGASRAAIAVYLGDKADLLRTAQVFRGWLGDRAAYSGFEFGDKKSWQANEDAPVAVNPVGTTKEGHSIDGALPEEMRRGGKFRWPPKETGYVWEALQGAVVQAEILHRRGFRTWEWQNQALRRAVTFLYQLSLEAPKDHWWASQDDTWVPWIVNARYGTDFPAVTPSIPGKNLGWADWTHPKLVAPEPAVGTSSARP